MRMSLPILLTFCICSLTAHAALWDRGNGMIYDDVLNITWMQDANYARTSGWSEENYVDPYDYDVPAYIYYGDEPLLNGRMGFSYAEPYIDQLVYGGYSDWRMPSIGHPISGCDEGIACSGYLDTGELGYMFYHNLGNTGGIVDPSCGEGIGCQGHNTGFLDVATNTMKYFSNVMASYFYQEQLVQNVLFQMSDGKQREVTAHYMPTAWVWAVRDGDVRKAPEIGGAGAPLALALLAGIVSLAGERRRNKRNTDPTL